MMKDKILYFEDELLILESAQYRLDDEFPDYKVMKK